MGSLTILLPSGKFLIVKIDYNYYRLIPLKDKVSKKSKRKQKHKPQRTCVGCRTVSTKRSMIRIVRTVDGIQVDQSGKLSGRGAYLHNSISCWEAGLKNSLSRSLKTNLTTEDINRLNSYMASLVEEE